MWFNIWQSTPEPKSKNTRHLDKLLYVWIVKVSNSDIVSCLATDQHISLQYFILWITTYMLKINIRFVNTTISWWNFISHIRLALLCDATEEIQFVNLAVKTQAQQLMFSRNLKDILLSFPILLFLLWWYSAFHVKLSASITHIAILNPQPCHLFVQIFMVTLTFIYIKEISSGFVYYLLVRFLAVIFRF